MEQKIEIDYDCYPHARGHEKDVLRDEDGHLRYRKNSVIKWLLDMGPIDLNQLWTTHAAGAFSLEDMMEFYRLIGYSLDGFEDVWHSRDPATRTRWCVECEEQEAQEGRDFCTECGHD